MRRIDKLADEKTSTVDDSEQFHDERLVPYSRDEWPSRIDRAALDVLFGVSIGSGDKSDDLGGTIGKLNFGDATGKHYVNGLTELADAQSDLPSLVKQYRRENGADSVGELAFRLNELRYELEQHLDSKSEIRNLNRAVEALIDKLATTSMSESVTRQALRDPESITDAMMQLFSDPAIVEYADVLTETMDEVAQTESFLERLDAPHMTTPLWKHQRDALREWVNHGCKGYVDMATATGKTVLGLAAVAGLYGELHPDDTAEIFSNTTAETKQQSLADELPVDPNGEYAQVLVVAGQELILEQWQSEFDEHLNIPRERTQTKGRTMEFSWGPIEFRSAPDLLQMDTLGGYDLVVLDEAHQYSRGGRSGGWQPVLEELAGKSDAILAMSGSIDTSWQGDSAVKRVLEEHLHECKRFSVDEARDAGVVADFGWNVYYAHAADSASQDGVVESTASIRKVYDPEQHKIRVDKLDGDVPSNVPAGFETLTDLRSFSQSKEGADARDASDAFDRLATDAFTRRPKRWQLHPPIQTLVELIGQHAPEQQCVVLVQSYEQADQIGDVLEDRYGEDLVLVPESGASEQFAEIASFKEKSRGIIVGPANVLGTGVDLPNAEVAINLSKGGVNASLIQRIGRVLRNPHGDKEAMFYQVVTLPSDRRGLLPGEDGRRLLRRASEFRALGARLRQLPGYDVADEPTSETLLMLEQHGVGGVLRDNRSIDEIVEDEVAQGFLRELCNLISSSKDENTEQPVLQTFNGSVLDRQARPVAEAMKKHPRTAASKPEEDTVSTGNKSESMSQSSKSSETSKSSMNTHAIEIEISPALNYLVEQELETAAYTSIDEFTDEVVGKYVSSELDGSAPETTSDDDFDVSLPPDIERVIEEEYVGSGADSVTQFVEEAIYTHLDLATGSKMLTVNLGSGLYQVSTTLAENSEGHGSVEEIVAEAIRSEFVR
ncbi:DEAD/DEAH box helicase [Halostagnicola bangensis]